MSSSSASNHRPRHHTFWCHECDMGVPLPVSPTNSPSPPLCPHCHSDFLERMDTFTPPPPLPSDSDSAPSHPFTTFLNPNTAAPPVAAAADDNYLLSSPYLRRLIQHLAATNAYAGLRNPRRNPASRNAINSLQEIKIDRPLLEKDPILMCPVCKDQFVVDMEVKMMPCNHIYHNDCIVPWLETNNSCPVCRFKLPTEEEEEEREVGLEWGDRVVEALRIEDLVDDGVDLFGFENALSEIARGEYRFDDAGQVREEMLMDGGSGGNGSEGFVLSPTQIGQTGAGMGAVERANSVETVSSWPTWHLEGLGDGEAGVSGTRFAGEDDAAVRS